MGSPGIRLVPRPAAQAKRAHRTRLQSKIGKKGKISVRINRGMWMAKTHSVMLFIMRIYGNMIANIIRLRSVRLK